MMPLAGPITVTFGARTDVGKVREANEDNFLVDRKLKLYIVCDGMGGHLGGEVASATAVNVVRETLAKRREVIDSFAFGDGRHDLDDVIALVEDAVHEANVRVFERGQSNAAQRGMGTTLSLLLLARDTAFVAHVGDTRIYRLRRGQLTQLTDDHSLVNEMARTMNMASDQFDDRLKNAITRAVGVHAVVEVDANTFELEPGDRFLLSSDGLHGLVDDAAIATVLGGDDLNACVADLVERANAAGGRDNITALVVQVEGAAEPIDAEERASLIESLKDASLFRGMSTLELRRVLEATTRRVLEPGELLVGQGRPQEALFMVARGHLEVTRNGFPVVGLGPGDHFGEDAILHESVSACTVRATDAGAAAVLALRAPAFDEMRATAPTVALKLAVAVTASLARRLHAVSSQLVDLRPVYLEPVGVTRRASRPRATGRFRVDTLSSTGRPPAQPRPRGAIPRVGDATTAPQSPRSLAAEAPPPLPSATPVSPEGTETPAKFDPE